MEKAYWYDSPFGIRSPDLSVFDPDSKLPLKLTRDGLSSELPFRAQLITEVVKDLLTHIMLDPWPDSIKKIGLPNELGVLRHRAAARLDSAGYVCFDRGFTLLDPQLLAQTGVKTLVCFGYSHVKLKNVISQDVAAVLYPYDSFTLNDAHRWARRCLDAVRDKKGFWDLPVVGVRIHAAADLADRWLNGRKIPLKLQRSIQAQQVAGIYVLTMGECDRSVIDWTAADSTELRACPMIVEVHFGTVKSKEIKTCIGEAVMKILKTPLIPYDRSHPDALAKEAMQALEPYLRSLKAVKESRKKNS